MNTMTASQGNRESTAAPTLVILALSVLFLCPLVGQLFSCLFWAYATRSDFNPLYQDQD
jgi:hypothetical protein